MNAQRRIGWTLVAVALPCAAFAVFFLVSALSMREPPHWNFGFIEGGGLVVVAICSASLLSGIGLLRHWRYARHSAATVLFVFLAFWGLGTLQFALALFFDTTELMAEVRENPAVSLGAITLSLAAFVWCLRSLWILLRQRSRDAIDA